MIKFLVILTMVGFYQSCNFSKSGGGGGGGLISDNKPVQNEFTVSVTSGMYINTDNIDINFTFPFNVTVVGTPDIALDIGGSPVNATYVSGDGTKVLTFRYTVSGGDSDLDGIQVSSPINLNGGSLTFVFDGSTINCNTTFNAPNSTSVLVDAVAASISSFTPPSNNLYTNGQDLDFTVTFDESVYVTGSPRLALNVGGSTLYANYASGSGTANLNFTYTVGSSDVDMDGIAVASPIDLNSGTIKDLGGNNAIISFIPPAMSNIWVNGDTPVVIGRTPPANDNYNVGENLDFVLTFSELVNVIGTPRLNITLGAATVYANYLSGSGSAVLTFRYTVQANDEDLNGIDLTPAIDLNGGSIMDVSLNPALVTFEYIPTGGIIVDGRVPDITSITPPSNNTYFAGQNLTFTVNWDMNVNVTGSPVLDLDIGGVSRQATYLSGSGSANLIFQYSVAIGDNDSNGIQIISPLGLNGGTIMSAVGIGANLAFTAPDTSGVIVDAAAGPSITSVTPPADATYTNAQNVDFTVNFDENVIVTGTPRLELTLTTGTVYADYQSGSGTSALLFSYVVGPVDQDLDGLTVVSPLDLNGGTIKDATTYDATLTFTPPTTTGVIIDGQGALITSITPPADGIYKEADTLDFAVTYSELVNVTGTPRIQITLNSGTVYANYLSGTGTTDLTFRYTVAASNNDSDGIVAISPIELNGGTIKDAALNDANLTFTPPNTTGVIVDTVHPTITSVTPPADATYLKDQNVDFIVNFDSNVIVTGTPRIEITLDSGTVYADYNSGTGTNALTFRFVVGNSDMDINGIVLVSPLQLNAGSLADVAGNASDLNYTLPITSGINVDGTAPEILSITPPADGTYLETQNMDFVVNYSETVNVTGTPRLEITLRTETIYADYLSGSGSSNLTFRHVVTNGEEDLDGIALVSPLQLSGGTIQNTALVNANLIFTPPTTSGINVDAKAPTITSVTVPTNGSYKIGDSLDFVINWDEAVILTGADSRVDLTIGATPIQATCVAGTGTTHNCSYTVQAGDEDTDGIVHVSPINAGTSTFQDAAGNSAVLTFTPTNTTAVLVDGIAPTITSITPPADSTYLNAQALSFTVNFSEAVTITGADSYLNIDIGGVGKTAICAAGTSTTTTCTYSVSPGDYDADGITMSSPVVLGTSTWADAAGNNVNPLTFTPPTTTGILVDANVPTITGITPPADGWYLETDQLDFTVTWSENVTISGTPRIAIDIGGTTKYATYQSGSGSTSTLFRYTVEAGVDDSDGITATSPMDLNSGTIKDSATNDAVLTFTPPTMTNVTVDTTIPSITSVTVPTNGSYKLGDTLTFTINWSESVTVTGADMGIDLTIGATARQAICAAGTGATTNCTYTVQAGDEDTDGIAHVSPVNLGTSTVQDGPGNNATLTFTPANTTAVLVDGIVPTITSVTAPADGTYSIGQDLDFTVNFSEDVTITGTTSYIDITVGANSRQATCATGTGALVLCSYTIQAGEEDSDGIAVASPAVLATSTWADAAGNNVNPLTFTPPTTTGILVDASQPIITNISVNSGTYLENDNVDFSITFSESVTITGNPYLEINVGGINRVASCNNGTNTSFTCSYTVVANEEDLDGIGMTSPINLNGGSIQDSNGNNAILTYSLPGNLNLVLVDSLAPSISSVSVPSNGTYGTGQDLTFTINWNENVTLSGSDSYVSINIGGNNRQAICNSGTGSSTTCTYTIQSGEEDNDGISHSSPIVTSTSTFQDAAGNNATLTFTPANTSSVLVAATDPGITISKTSAITDESGLQDTFTIVLDSPPSNNVTINISSSDTTEGTVSPSSVVFTSGNWSTPQTITITGIDDSVVDGNILYTIITSAAISSDLNYNGLNPSDVSVVNIDSTTSAGITVTAISGNTDENGQTATFTIRLDSEPTNDVTINVSSNDTTEGTVSPTSLTFTSLNWSTPQTITVTGVDDAIEDSDQTYVINIATATSSDPDYNGLDAPNINVINLDNDSIGVVVSNISGNTSESGTTATFTMKLKSQPSNDVTFNISSADISEGVASTSSVVFTNANWSTIQTITITGQDDILQDGNQPYQIIIGASTSADPNYNGIDPTDLIITNLDDDSFGILVSSVSGNTTETGGSATYTVVLQSQPSADVTFNISSSDTSEGTVSPSNLVFTNANWSTPQTVTITGVDDALQDGNQQYIITNDVASSSDSNYNGINPDDITLNNIDDDSIGFAITPTSGHTVSEEGTDTSFTVALTSQPTASVSIPISSDDTTEGTVSTSSLTFTTSNWAVPQTVTVTGVDDALQDGTKLFSIIIGTATSSDGNYNGLNPDDINVFNYDNDSVGVMISKTSSTSNRITVSESGTYDTFTIVLTSQPSDTVTIPLSSNDTSEATVSPSSLIFTVNNWNVPQTVTVTGVDDAFQDGDRNVTISINSLSSNDSNYNGINPNDMYYTCLDDDSRGVRVLPETMPNQLVISETGTQEKFTMVLESQPSANVVITMTENDTSEGTVSPSSFTFTPENWNIPQTGTVTGADDALTDGNMNWQINSSASSSDGNYNGIGISAVRVTTTDDDSPGFHVSPDTSTNDRLTVGEDLSQQTITVVLTSQPSANVTLYPFSTDTTEGVISVTSLTFTPENWDAPQTFILTGVDDNTNDGDRTFDIQWNSTVSGDGGYNNNEPARLRCQNIDNE